MLKCMYISKEAPHFFDNGPSLLFTLTICSNETVVVSMVIVMIPTITNIRLNLWDSILENLLLRSEYKVPVVRERFNLKNMEVS